MKEIEFFPSGFKKRISGYVHNNLPGIQMSEKQKIKLEKSAEKATRWIGSTSSLITHTVFFIISFSLPVIGLLTFGQMLLILTTVVSLEAIYLAIFIQMSVNKNISDIENIQEDVGEIQEDIEGIEGDIDEIQKDVDEIQEDVGEIQEDLDTDVVRENADIKNDTVTLETLNARLMQLQEEIRTFIKLHH
jgi:peptidoglycan hydrolase CwlO-like protein